MDKSITVERVRHALVVGRLDTDGAAVLLAANLPAKHDRTFVVVGASSLDAMTRLDPWVLADLADEVRGDLCVVAPRFGAMGANGKLPPARLLADRLGVEVTAADGDPVSLPDGSVFVPGRTAGWVSYRPGGQRIQLGARLPAPWWQAGLPAPTDEITHVPVGLWLRRPGADRPADPLLRQVPDHDRMYVVVGAPDEEPPAATTVTEVLRALPDENRNRAVLAWYGTTAAAQPVADELGAPVRVAQGVPADGDLVAAAVEEVEPEEATSPTGAVVVTADGRILPAEPILTLPSTHPATIDIRDGVLTVDLPDDEEEIPAVAAVTVAPAVEPQTPLPAQETASITAVAGFAEAAPEPAVIATVVPLVPATSSTVDSVAGLLPGRETPRPTVAAPVEVPEDARSTAEQRRAMRGKLGPRYDVATRAVTQLLSERPGLRFGTGDRAALLTELAVVRVFADEPDGDYDADFYTCLADGLRRLPTARAVVVRGIPEDTDLRPESVLRLPTPVVAASVATGDVGPAEALIWTTTARRLDGFFDEDSAEVVLSGHTRLRVLAVEDTPVRRVLLAEDGCAQDAALARLRAAAAARAVSAEPSSAGRWFGPLPAA